MPETPNVSRHLVNIETYNGEVTFYIELIAITSEEFGADSRDG